MSAKEQLYQRIIGSIHPKVDRRVKDFFDAEYEFSKLEGPPNVPTEVYSQLAPSHKSKAPEVQKALQIIEDCHDNAPLPFIDESAWNYVAPLFTSGDKKLLEVWPKLFDRQLRPNLPESKLSMSADTNVMHLLTSLPYELSVARYYCPFQTRGFTVFLNNTAVNYDKMIKDYQSLGHRLRPAFEDAINSLGEEIIYMKAIKAEASKPSSQLRRQFPFTRGQHGEADEPLYVIRYLDNRFRELFGSPALDETAHIVNMLYGTVYTANDISNKI